MPRITDEDKLYAISLGRVLRTVRNANKLTQAEVEEDLGLSPQTLGRWERGDHAPKGYNFGRLFRYYEPLGAQLSDFLDPPEIVTINPLRDRLATRPRPTLVPTPAEEALTAKVVRSGAAAGVRKHRSQPAATPSTPRKSPQRRAPAK